VEEIEEIKVIHSFTILYKTHEKYLINKGGVKMKSKGKKFLSAVLVSSMILTSSLGFMPRTAQAIDDASVYSYSFDYIDGVTKKGNKLIVLKTDENLTGYDTTLFSIEGNKAEIGNIDLDAANDEIRIEVTGIDPEIMDYKLIVKAGGLEFSGYQQLADITIDFKSYEITPGFKSIFKDEAATNDVFDNNTPESIKIFVDSDYITEVSAKTLSGEVNWTEFKVAGADGVHSISFEVLGISGDATRKVDSKNSDDKYTAIYAGVSDTKDVVISAYDAQGRKLDTQVVRYNFGSAHGTNFDSAKVKSFDAAGYSVRDLLDGTADKTLDELLAGKSYGELDQVKVYYKNIDSIIKVSSANELAAALAKLGTSGSLKGQAVKIKLDADITVGSPVTFAHDASLMIEGNSHTLTGNVTLGDGTDKVVKLSNMTVDGDITVNVGDAGDAYLTNVTLGAGKQIVVQSGGYSSVTLVNTKADTMNIDNDTSTVHVIAGKDTAIQTTNVIGTYDVKMTSRDGGLFNVISLQNDKELYLVGDANSPFKTVKVKDGITPRATIKLAANTTVENLDVKSPVTMTGKSSSKVVNATVDSGLAAGAVNYDGFVIQNASGDKFVGTNVPGASSGSDLEVPTTSDNKLVLSGTVYGTHVSDVAMNAGGKTLVMTLEGAASDRPLNIKWDNSNESAFKTAIAALISESSGTTLKQEANFDVSVNADKTEVTITWNSNTSVSITDTLTVTIDEAVLKTKATDLFVSQIDTSKLTSAAFDIEVAKDNSLYRPTFYSNLNKFLVYKDSSNAIDSVQISANKTLSDVALTGANNTIEYKTSKSDWISGANADVDANADVSVGANGYTVISLRSTGSNDSVDKFTLKENEVWFNTSASASDIAGALNDTDVTRVYIAAKSGAYDLSGETITDRVGNDVEVRAYAVGSESKVTLELGTVEDIGDLDIGSNIVVSDTLAPTIVKIEGTTVENGSDTIAMTFSESMNEASVENIANWTFDYNDNTSGANNKTITKTDATIVYDEATKIATVTLKDVAASALVNTKFVGVTPTADVKDLSNQAMATSKVYGTSQSAITGDTNKPTATLVAKLTDTNGVVLDRAVKSGETVFVEATFSEAMADAPIVKLETTTTAISAANMTKVSDTNYTIALIVPAGDGDAVYSLSVGTDLAGNVITGAPTGAVTKFVVDNTVPTASLPGSTDPTTNDADSLVATFDSDLYISGTAVADGADVKTSFTAAGGTLAITTAIYDATNKTVTFTLANAADTNTLTHNTDGTKLTDAAGNAYAAKVYTYAAAGTKWSSN
jgi:hypothetical protein